MNEKISRFVFACSKSNQSSETEIKTGKSPVGRLRSNLGLWGSIEASRYVLSDIDFCYICHYLLLQVL